jgi:hypothetical protein
VYAFTVSPPCVLYPSLVSFSWLLTKTAHAIRIP